MKKKTVAKLSLSKIRIATLSKSNQEVLKGGKARRCTDVEFCPTLETCKAL